MYRKTIITALMTMIAGAGNVQASNVKFMGVSLKSSVSFSHKGSNMSTTAGEILIDFNSEQLKAYCVDIDHSIKGAWDATIAPITDVNGGKAIAFLYDTFHGSVINNVQAAALQVAIWEVLDDFGGTLNLTAGNFKLLTTGNIKTTAQSYLNALPADLTRYQTTSSLVKSGNDPRSQNLIVPEPMTIVFLAFMAPMLITARKSNRRTRAQAA